MSWNRTDYRCTCGECHWCRGEKNRKSIYKAPPMIREEFFQKKVSEEQALLDRGWIKIDCPKCKQQRLVDGASLSRGFSCDRCGYKAEGGGRSPDIIPNSGPNVTMAAALFNSRRNR